MSLDLRAVIREHALEHTNDGPNELAKRVVDLVSDHELRDALRQTLTPFVTDVLRTERNAVLREMASVRNSRLPNPSPKTRDIRNGFARLCAQRVHVGGKHWKTLGECDIADLEFCITEREQTIVQIETRIADYRRLADLLAEHNVERVADLPEASVF